MVFAALVDGDGGFLLSFTLNFGLFTCLSVCLFVCSIEMIISFEKLTKRNNRNRKKNRSYFFKYEGKKWTIALLIWMVGV